jgi:hypothetical protein
VIIQSGESIVPLAVEAREADDDNAATEASNANDNNVEEDAGNDSSETSDTSVEEESKEEERVKEIETENIEEATTRSGRTSKPSARLIEEIGAIATGEFALGAMAQFDDANFVEQDDDDEDVMCEPERCYFDRMMAIDDGKIVSGEILPTAIEMHGGLEENFHQ